MKSFIKILLREGLLGEEDYYTTTLPNDVKARSSKYVGNNVVWYGDPDEMIVVHKSNVNGMFGNVYDQDKMNFIVDMIQNQDGREEQRVELETSYAFGEVVNIIDIKEEQNAQRQDRFQSDYNGLERPRSTGNEELDIYLGVEYLDEFDGMGDYVENHDLYKIFDNFKGYVGEGQISTDKVISQFNELTDGSEEDKIALKQFLNYENMIKDSITNKTGDIGQFFVQLRDGHHRVMGAIEAGEEYVCVDLGDDGIENFKGFYTKVENN